MLSFYVALAVLWLVLIGAGYLVLGRDVPVCSLVRARCWWGFPPRPASRRKFPADGASRKNWHQNPGDGLCAAAGLFV